MEQPEHRLQIACATHLRHILSPNIFWTARDLATSRASEGEKKKAMGCKPGLSDIEIWMVGPRRRLHLELKVAKSRVSALGKLSDTQRAMIPVIEAYGEAFDVVWSVASLEEALTRHGVPWRQQAMFPTAEQRDISLATTPARKWRSFKRPSAAKIRKARAIRQHTMF